jgi:hypothetical protein
VSVHSESCFLCAVAKAGYPVSGDRRHVSIFKFVGHRIYTEPFETFIGLIAFVQGMAYAFGATTPTTVSRTLPHWFLIIWGLYLIVGGGLILLGLLNGRRLLPPGLFLLAGGLIVYSIAVVSAGIPGSAFAAGFSLALSAACAVRGFRETGWPSWTRR